MGLIIIVVLSVVAQLGAAVLALRLIRVTGRQMAWLLVSLALFGMAVRRIMHLYWFLAGHAPTVMDPANEVVGLLVSLCMLAGIAGIAPVFESIRVNAEKLGRSEEKFRRIVETAQEGVLFIDAGGQASYFNRRMADLLGRTEDELRGRPLDGILADSSCVDAMRRMATVGEGTAEHHDCRLRREDGSTVWVIASANPLRDDDGTAIGALAMFADISDRKQMEQEREVLIRELQDALGKVKTLKGLLPICGWCNKVRDDRGDWHPMEVYIKINSDASFSHGICPECRDKIREGP